METVPKICAPCAPTIEPIRTIAPLCAPCPDKPSTLPIPQIRYEVSYSPCHIGLLYAMAKQKFCKQPPRCS